MTDELFNTSFLLLLTSLYIQKSEYKEIESCEIENCTKVSVILSKVKQESRRQEDV